ncbi:MAG: DUF4157 domain-containing protein [Ginsengibacter sp.]
MNPTYTRRYRRRASSSREMGMVKRESQREQAFFGDAIHETFFQPATQIVNRKCEKCEEGDKKVKRMPEKKEEEKKLQRVEDKKEEEKKIMKMEEKKDEEKVQKKEAANSSIPGKGVSNYISSLNGKGQPLTANANQFFSSKMGYDFSNVKIHNNKAAAESAKDINAKAYTVGNNIVFNEGQYNFESGEGKRLMAHELAHVVQKNSGSDAGSAIHRKSLTELCGKKDFAIYNDMISGVDFRVGLVKGKRRNEIKKYKKKIEGNIESMAARINLDNQFIKNPKQHVKQCYIFDTTTRLALKNGENILLIHPKFAEEQTIAHEMGHALFAFMKNNIDNSLMDVKRTSRFQLKIAEIFERLRVETIRTPKGAMSAANIVDPSIWGGLAPEHPTQNVDEFFGSAKSAFQVNKKALINLIEKAGRDNRNVFFAGVELIKVLDDFFTKGELPGVDEKIENEKNAVAMIAGMGDPSSHEATLLTSAIFQNLLNNSC